MKLMILAIWVLQCVIVIGVLAPMRDVLPLTVKTPVLALAVMSLVAVILGYALDE